jgi:hypothetical protein
MRRALRFLQLSLADKAMLAGCLWRLASTYIALQTRGYHRASHDLTARLARRRPSGGQLPSAAKIIWAVRAAARVLPRTRCLAQAVTLHYLLARSGHASIIRIGITGDKALSLQAHAWVVRNGRIVIGETGAADGRFRTMTELQLAPR